MIREISFFSAIFALLFIGAPCLNATCQPVVRAEDNSLLGKDGKSRGPAVVSSTPVQVPQLKLRFVGENNQPARPQKVTVTYNWKWWEYPYPEHAWGAWSDGFDFVKCTVGTDESVLTIPEYTVTPKGWYKGKYIDFPWSHKPRFNGLSIHVTAPACASTFSIERSNFEQYDGKVGVIELSCSQRPKISFTNN